MIVPQPSTRAMSREHAITVNDVFLTQKLSLQAIFSLFQEIASEHAEVLGWGWDNLQTRNEFWVLSKMRLQLFRYAAWREKISIHTWPDGTDGLQAYRHFLIVDAAGKPVVYALSSWLVVNAVTRRLSRLNAEKDGDLFVAPGEHVVKPQKIAAMQNPALLAKFRVCLSDVDMNQHVNNVTYSRWLFDALPLEQLKAMQVEQVEIDFLKEAHYGETVTVQYEQVDEKTSLANIMTDTGNEACRFKLVCK